MCVCTSLNDAFCCPARLGRARWSPGGSFCSRAGASSLLLSPPHKDLRALPSRPRISPHLARHWHGCLRQHCLLARLPSSQAGAPNTPLSSTLSVSVPHPRPQAATEVFVAKLPRTSADIEADIREVFSVAGDILELRVPVGPDGLNKGIAFVRYADPEAATLALRLDGAEVMGAAVAVRRSLEKTSVYLGGCGN